MQLRQDLKELAITASGALLFSYNLAPTEEILQISSRLSAWQHLLIVAVSLVLAYMILFAAEFRERSVHVRNWFQRPSVETVMAYAVSLGVAFLLLQLVGVREVKGNWPVAIEASVVLGLPAVIGASAGRLIA
jgi:putative integral membrane protein (TIGR02587 family)